MKEWKIRQQASNKLTTPTDVADTYTWWNRELMTEGAFENAVLEYFTKESDGSLDYPQKAYAVALIYAKLMEECFGEDFLVALDDPELLLGDQFFVRYSEDKATYDAIILAMTQQKLWDFESNPFSQVQATLRYFEQEFFDFLKV